MFKSGRKSQLPNNTFPIFSPMKRIFLWLMLLPQIILLSQSRAYTSAEIYDDLLRLKNNVTVMYVAAHPDDENTRMISWLTHEKHVDAVYLSLTRGDGGQNLIGTEKGEMLGLIRTQELLEARKTDKGRQWFTRAVDFGYSKNTEDTFNHWERDEILADVVWAVRVNRPEIIITRFHPESNGQTHGHHTASAQLAMKAFELAGDPNAYPEQLKLVESWQPKRIFYNTSWWFYGSEEAFAKVDKSNMITVDLGTYFPHLGASNNEIAAHSRSKHASQGFGTALSRGTETEWLELLKGNMPETNDIFAGIPMKWEDNQMQQLIDQIIASFDFKNPEKSASQLMKLYTLMENDNASHFRRNMVKELILRSKGIYMEWSTPERSGVSGYEVPAEIEISNRGKDDIEVTMDGKTFTIESNNSYKAERNITPEKNLPDSPYWLRSPQKDNMFQTPDYKNLGLPEFRNEIVTAVTFNLNGVQITKDIPLRQKTVDPSKGEEYQNFYVMPEYVVNFSQPHYLFKNQPREVKVDVTSFAPDSKGEVELKVNNGWKVSPKQQFSSAIAGAKTVLSFTVTPPQKATEAEISAVINNSGENFSQSLQYIEYPHINRQIWLHDALAKVKNLDILVPDVKVLYIQGSGDDVPEALRQMGVEVVESDLSQWNAEILKDFDVAILGIRAFNTKKELSYIQHDIWNFVENGGVAMVQYNTSRELIGSQIAPFDLKLGRDRIAEEDATMKILQPKHAVFNVPNKITQADFQNWEQERGLYFASEWDEKLIPMLEGNDTGESPKQGILLVGNHGKGKFVYTGISFFRQLPAGVPGAYRLFMNLLAL